MAHGWAEDNQPLVAAPSRPLWQVLCHSYSPLCSQFQEVGNARWVAVGQVIARYVKAGNDAGGFHGEGEGEVHEAKVGRAHDCADATLACCQLTVCFNVQGVALLRWCFWVRIAPADDDAILTEYLADGTSAGP